MADVNTRPNGRRRPDYTGRLLECCALWNAASLHCIINSRRREYVERSQTAWRRPHSQDRSLVCYSAAERTTTGASSWRNPSNQRSDESGRRPVRARPPRETRSASPSLAGQGGPPGGCPLRPIPSLPYRQQRSWTSGRTLRPETRQRIRRQCPQLFLAVVDHSERHVFVFCLMTRFSRNERPRTPTSSQPSAPSIPSAVHWLTPRIFCFLGRTLEPG